MPLAVVWAPTVLLGAVCGPAGTGGGAGGSAPTSAPISSMNWHDGSGSVTTTPGSHAVRIAGVGSPTAQVA